MLRTFGVTPIVTTQGKRLGIYYFEQGASERPGKVVYDQEDSSFSLLRKRMIDWKAVLKMLNGFIGQELYLRYLKIWQCCVKKF